MSRILVGTSGYGYHEWVGPVYPEGTRPEDYLSVYARLFPTVELNFSYYKMPDADQLARIADQAGQSLLFSVKANDSLTHRVDPASWKDSLRLFRAALAPLLDRERLAAVLLQFPYSFHYDPDRRRYLDALLKAMAPLPLAVEFRNNEWYNNRVIDSFRDRRVALAALDLPALKGLPPLVDVVTAPFAYLRLHGRNGEAWWGSDSASRYDYLYSDAELATFVERIKALAARAERVFVYFNNHRRGQAVRNGLSLADRLRRDGLLP